MVTDSALMAALTVVLALAAFFLPVVGVILVFFLPAPVALVGVRHGLGPAGLSIVVAGAIIALFLGPVQALGLALLFGLMGLAFGYGIRQGWDAGRTILLGAVAVLLVAGASVGISLLFLHQNPLLVVWQSFQVVLDKMSQSSYSSVQAVAANYDKMLDALRKNPIPGVAPAAAAFVIASSIYYAALRPLFRRLGVTVPRLTSFAGWTVPTTVAWFWFGAMLLTYLGGLSSFAWLVPGATILYYGVMMIFLVIGASVLYYFLRSWRVGPVVAGILAVIVAMNGFWITVLVFAGLWEVLFGLRANFAAKLPEGHALRKEMGDDTIARLVKRHRPMFGPPRPRPNETHKRQSAASGEDAEHETGPGGGKVKRKAKKRGTLPASRRRKK